MKLGIFAKTFGGSDPEAVLQQVKTAGYAAVQYNMACSGIGALPTNVPEATADAVASASVKADVAIAAVSATYNMVHPDLAVPENGRAAFTAIAANARRMGTHIVTLCTGSRDAADQWRHHPDNEGLEAWREMLREFEFLIRLADKYDVNLGVEPELANVVSSAHKARALIDTLRSDRIKVVLDAANLFETEMSRPSTEVIREAIGLLDDCIVLAHAKDRNTDGTFATVGKGVIDFEDYVDALREFGFDGVLVTHGLPATEAVDVAEYLGEKIARVGGA